MSTVITSIAVVLIAIVQLMDVLNMSTTTKRLKKLEEEHDHLARKCGEALRDTVIKAEEERIKQRIENMDIREHAERVIKAADDVIKASDDLNDTYKEFIETVNSQEEETDDEETGR